MSVRHESEGHLMACMRVAGRCALLDLRLLRGHGDPTLNCAERHQAPDRQRLESMLHGCCTPEQPPHGAEARGNRGEVTHLDGTSESVVERRRAAVMRRTCTLVARLNQGGVKWWTAS